MPNTGCGERFEMWGQRHVCYSHQDDKCVCPCGERRETPRLCAGMTEKAQQERVVVWRNGKKP